MADLTFDQRKTEQYENMARKAVFAYDELFTMVLAQLKDITSESANILVVGSGTGMELMVFGSKMPQWNLMGVDPSEEMIKASRHKIESGGFRNRVTLHNGFIEGLPEEDTYDAATLIFVLRFVPDDKAKIKMLQNIAKRMKNGASLILVDQFGDVNDNIFQKNLKAWKNFMIFGGLSNEQANTIMDQALAKSLITELQLENILRRAGLEITSHFYNAFIHIGYVVQKVNL